MSPDVRTAPAGPLSSTILLADEAALKREFDAELAGSLATAREQLGADAAVMAPKVVESAFANIWNQRDLIHSHEELKATLATEIRHGAARALSRRASAGRFAAGKHAHTAHAATSESPADLWAAIQKAIHPETSDALHAATAVTGRHEAASHMKAVAKRPSWIMPVTIGVFAIAVAGGGMIYLNRLSEDDGALALVANASIQPFVQSVAGQIGNTTLGDGSKLRIGPETKIYIPDEFPEKARVIRVDGTAQFEVAKDGSGAEHPFRVIARRTHFVASGTRFVVSTFAGDSAVAVLVKEGTVTVKAAKTKTTTTLSADQALVVDKGVPREATADERAELFGWVDGRVTVQHKQLRTVIAALTRWFNYDVKVIDLPLLDRDASFDVPLDSSGLAITQVEKSANVQFAWEGETKIFRDATKKKK